MATQTSSRRSPDLRWLLLVALALSVGAYLLAVSGGPDRQDDPTAGAVLHRSGRLVLVVVDSLREESVDALMPTVRALGDGGVRAPIATCRGNFTLPCMQTLLEGRESPFVAGIQNFTGREGSAGSFPAIAKAAGRRVALLSDHTLGELYGSQASISIDEEKYGGSYLDRDLHLISDGVAILRDDAADVLVLHMTGTDKVAHKQKPGTSAYAEHWSSVDAALGDLFATLNLQRDSVIVTGDHGHDDHGHHTRRSLAVFAGPIARDVASHIPTKSLRQIDVAYFLAYGSGTVLPSAYEGGFWVPTPPPAGWEEFEAIQRTGDLSDGSIDAMLDTRREQRRQGERAAAWSFLPILLIGASLAALLLTRADSRVELRDAAAVAVVTIALVLDVLLDAVPAGLVLAAFTVVAALTAARSQKQRLAYVGVVALVVFASLAGAYARPFADFFHTRGGARPVLLVLFAGVMAVGLLGAGTILRDLRRWPEATALASVTVLPSGVYYYQSGQNFFSGFVIALVLMGIVYGWRGPRAAPLVRLAIVAAATCAGLLLAQEAGGWEWKNYPITALGRTGPAAQWAALAASTAGLTLLLPTRRARGMMLGWLLFATAYTVGFAELPLSLWIGAQVPVLGVAAIFFAAREGFPKRLGRPMRAEPIAAALLLLIAALCATWMTLQGFFVRNIDFSFAMRALSGVELERNLFLLSFPLTTLKYAGSGVTLAIVAGAFFSRHKTAVISVAAAGFALLKLTALGGQVLFGRAYEPEKLYELAAADFFFVFCASSLLVVSLVAVSLMSRAFGSGEPEDMATPTPESDRVRDAVPA